MECVLNCVVMATHDPSNGDADSIPTTPLGADPLVPQPTAISTATAPTPPDKPGFFRRTWVWVTAAAVAAVILLGGGIGIGAALTHESGDSYGSSFDHQSQDDGDSNGHPGPQGHGENGEDQDGDHHGRGNRDDDGGAPQVRPAPAPSDDGTTNP